MEIFIEQAPTYEQCKKKILNRYGNGVTFIRTKNIKVRKFFGLAEADMVEISFSVCEQPQNDSIQNQDPLRKIYPIPQMNDKDEKMKIISGYMNKNPIHAKKLQPYLSSTIKSSTLSQTGSADTSVATINKLISTVQKLVTQVEKQKVETQETEHQNILKIAQILEENDFTASYITHLCATLKNTLSYTEIENLQTVQEKLLKLLAQSIKISHPKPENKTQILLLVGPTGVGKTTTLAKLAAQYFIKEEKKVRAITIDKWRIGAVYQIERYCDIMGIDLTVVSRPDEFRTCMDLYRGETDVICIDTTGRSPHDRTKLAEMLNYFSDIDETTHTYLTIAAGTRINDIREIMKQYAIFKYKALIITKFDETSYIGNILSVMAEKEIPITYLTTGQDVPKDIQPAEKHHFLEKLKGFSVNQEYICSICTNTAEESLVNPMLGPKLETGCQFQGI